MKTGTVFDIKEFSVYDGPGVRVTVFLKGCPLRCAWCHNPEGLTSRPQLMLSSSCVSCGECLTDCPLTGGKEALLSGSASCKGCGECLSKCPNGFRKLSGKEYTSEELKARLMKYKDFISDGGGVTFSGGEPTMQSEFLLEMLNILPFHRAIQTCGYCDKDIFLEILEKADFLFFDIKHTDPEAHKLYTGVDNKRILENLDAVKRSGKPFIARIPMLSGINDGEENLRETARLLKDAKKLQRVELLPYNGAAGAKYQMVGKAFEHDFRSPEVFNTSIFTEAGITVKVL